MLVSPVLQAYAGYASACDNFLQPARKLSQVLVSLVLQVFTSCHKCLFNLFYKCLQVVTSGSVDLRKPA